MSDVELHIKGPITEVHIVDETDLADDMTGAFISFREFEGGTVSLNIDREALKDLIKALRTYEQKGEA